VVASRRLLCRRYDNSDCRLLLLIVVGAVEDEVVVANVSLAHVLHPSWVRQLRNLAFDVKDCVEYVVP